MATTIDIDRDAAHDAAGRELGKLIYPKPSFTEQIADWIQRLLYRLTAGAASVPGGWLTIAVLLVLLALAIVVVVRIARNAMRSSRAGTVTLYGGHELSAAEHRATAERYAAAGDWSPAIRHRLRAVARQLEESGVLDAVPARTATEFARAAAEAFPDIRDQLTAAADAFNDVTYGELPGSEPQYRSVAGLDAEVGRRRAPAHDGRPTETAAQPWAEVR
ncbi:hypothetical protein Mycch_4806 [Mycolicibacterium chubuense NBB4]|uniref:Protein-glutamine gamma-glutamyltransferase-like C-terminal domain-containing protein n=1 Tax=Mycolicibacterium chubuense (strain NBB4) TaxID=710421 RepID=I4BQE4_MYCCN|nr:DUF4129 domain-containing protein [Mycolicibacterium chubuense]AFM19501.1 hypothetical protein Mycch_4806 [Mycolicibacterium chubuense NBB4]